MRSFTLFAAIGAALLVTTAAAAGDKPDQPKAKKICTEVEPAVGRLPAKRICRIVTPAKVETAETQREVRATDDAAESTAGNR